MAASGPFLLRVDPLPALLLLVTSLSMLHKARLPIAWGSRPCRSVPHNTAECQSCHVASLDRLSIIVLHGASR